MQVKSKIFASTLALILVVLAVLYMAGSFSDKQSAGLKTILASDYKGEVATLSLKSIERFELVPGTIIAKQNTQVSSRVMAQVKRLNVRAGDTVKAGDVLLVLEQDDFIAKLSQSQAQISAITASLTQAKKQLDRIKTLRQDELVSVSDLDEAQARYDNLNANLVIAKQQQAQAEVALSYTTIKSPISGKVVERFSEPGDTATPGIPLLAIYNPQQLQFEFNVREQQAVKLALGQRLNVAIPALNTHHMATVTEIVPIADSAARSMVVRLELEDQINLMPGLYAQLKLPQASLMGILVKPEWIHYYGQLAMVYVLNNSQIERRYVRLGERNNQMFHIVSGLKAGDKLAVDYKPVN